MTSHEKLVHDMNKSGLAAVEAKLKADQLTEDSKPFLSSLMNALDDGAMPEAKIKRLAEGSKEYRDYIRGMVLAKAEAARALVRWESYCNLFEAWRTVQATERVRMGVLRDIP